jgi:hypothetical protein
MAIEGKWLEMPIASQWAEVYSFKDRKCIVLFKDVGSDGAFRGDVFYKLGWKAEQFKEDDYETLKLKCIIKAKELGWNMNNVFTTQKEVNYVCRSNFFSEAIKEINRKGKKKSFK